VQPSPRHHKTPQITYRRLRTEARRDCRFKVVLPLAVHLSNVEQARKFNRTLLGSLEQV